MKRNYPYTGPGSQGQGASQPAYGQPPPPAGPAPPLPSSGLSQGACANYGYGSVAPARNTAPPSNGAHPPQWNQQWPQPQQPQQPYYPPQQPNAVSAPGAGQFAGPRPPSQPRPYRPVAGPIANSSSVSQSAAYSPHQPQQSVPYSYQPQASPMHSQSASSHHHQPVAPPAYGYTPPMTPNQNLSPSPHSSNVQSWPGAYAPGSQVGPPNKKPRYQAPAANAPAPPTQYGPPGVVPMAPAGGHMAVGAMNQYHPPPQQQYGWQGPHPTPPQQMNQQPVPGPSAPHGRVPSVNGFNANVPSQGAPFVPPIRNDTGGKGAGGVGGGMNRKGAQNRGSMQTGQRAGLPANPTASVNAARAPNGQTRAWGASGTGDPSDRRVSSASSVHSDKALLPGQAKKAVPGSKVVIPPNAPRGPSNARNQMAPNAPATASQISKGGGAAAQSAAVAASASGDIGAKDNAASSKRAHTDFRILGLEIKQLDWSWFAPSALAKAEDSSRDPTNEEPDSTQNPDEGAQEAKVAFAVAAVEDLSSKGHDAEAEASHAQGSARPDGRNDESNETKGENSAKDEHADTNIPDRGNAGEVAGIDASDAADAAADADDDGDVDADAVADADADADGDDDADAHAGDDEGDPKAEGEDAQDAGDNVSMSHADETAPSEHQHSVASTPEPSSERSKDPAAKDSGSAAQKGPKSKAEGAKLAANLRDSTKLRLCFAAMSNAGPEGAPTGPKSSKMQALKTETESNFQEETIAELTVPDPNTTEEAEAREPSTAETKADDVGLAQELTEIKSEPEQPLVQTREDNIALGSDDAEAPPANTSTELADATTAVTDANVKEKKKEDVEEGGAAEKNVAVKQEDDEQIDQIAAEHQDDETTSEADKNKKSRLTAEPSPPAKGPPQLSLNRIFLSFAANRKRLAIDAEAVKSVKIHRSEHWIEICIDASQQDDHAHRKKGGEYLVCRGSLLEKRTKGQENYTAVSRTDIAAAWDAANGDASDDDHLELPPFFRLPSSSPELVLHVRLDPSAPLPEPAWLRKNDVAELLANLQRGSSAIAGQSDTAVSVATAQHVWAGKIQVLDPDPPPSMSTFMYEWVKGSFIGSQKERRKFVDELLGKTAVKVEGTMVKVEEGADADNERDARVARSFVEIVLRLIKGERVTSTIDSSVFTAALASTSYTSSTTYPGLFMLGLLEVALAADPAQVREQVDRMLMAFPRATLVKAVDLTWKDVVESGRKGEAPIPAAAPAPARPAGSQRRQHQNGRQHHHGGGAQNRHGKRKRG